MFWHCHSDGELEIVQENILRKKDIESFYQKSQLFSNKLSPTACE